MRISTITLGGNLGRKFARPPRRRNQKPRICGAFVSSGGGIRTRDLRVMSPTSYQTAPPRVASHVVANKGPSQKPWEGNPAGQPNPRAELETGLRHGPDPRRTPRGRLRHASGVLSAPRVPTRGARVAWGIQNQSLKHHGSPISEEPSGGPVIRKEGKPDDSRSPVLHRLRGPHGSSHVGGNEAWAGGVDLEALAG
jgi:hypothetical protein